MIASQPVRSLDMWASGGCLPRPAGALSRPSGTCRPGFQRPSPCTPRQTSHTGRRRTAGRPWGHRTPWTRECCCCRNAKRSTAPARSGAPWSGGRRSRCAIGGCPPEQQLAEVRAGLLATTKALATGCLRCHCPAHRKVVPRVHGLASRGSRTPRKQWGPDSTCCTSSPADWHRCWCLRTPLEGPEHLLHRAAGVAGSYL
mmetsp:Transcript_80430/g.236606  ORF Transcript_80430/g.236606 Transcript_80430/m.236606 type:complete len:200 (-) Transcript_80430:788-1387(-)